MSGWYIQTPSSTLWNIQDYFYFVDPNAWCVPLDEDFVHLRESANPQEFIVFPESVELEPEYAQAGVEEWTLTESFYLDSSWTVVDNFYIDTASWVAES